MVGRTTGAVLYGLEARLVHVEVDLAGGLPTIAAVGLPDSAVREGIDRIRSALINSGFKLPDRRIVVNLAPAGLRKQGAALDLPIVAALLEADGRVPGNDPARTVLVGELSLDGGLRPVAGILSIALAAAEAGRSRIVVPSANADEARLIRDIEVIPIGSLSDLVALGEFANAAPNPPRAGDPFAALTEEGSNHPLDLSDVMGQSVARRALEVAAAGGHHLLLVGPPGAGKTMLSRRLPGILPPLTPDEALEVTRVWSAAGLSTRLVTRRPFRAPHHQISYAGMTGGGSRLRPGEITLASGGVLYLDELTEFRRDALESLRQPLEEGKIQVVRIHATAEFPANFTLIASMNPCPCGYHGEPDGRCNCSPSRIRRYVAKLSGPLIDRFDLVVRLPPVDLACLGGKAAGEPSSIVRGRVVSARRVQWRRLEAGGAALNGRMSAADLTRWARLDGDGRRLLLDSAGRLGLTARGFDRVRRVSRTLADLDGQTSIEVAHVAEALQYRHQGLDSGETTVRESAQGPLALTCPRLAGMLLRRVAISGSGRLNHVIARVLMATATTVKLAISSKVGLIDLVHSAAEKMAELAGFDADESLNVGLAVREAVINAMVHGNGEDPELPVDVTLEANSTTLVAKIRDHGGGFDPDLTPDPTDAENLLEASGRGLLMIRAFVDDVEYRRASTGMELTLTKRIQPDQG